MAKFIIEAMNFTKFTPKFHVCLLCEQEQLVHGKKKKKKMPFSLTKRPLRRRHTQPQTDKCHRWRFPSGQSQLSPLLLQITGRDTGKKTSASKTETIWNHVQVAGKNAKTVLLWNKEASVQIRPT